jgi:hypothetical protein
MVEFGAGGNIIQPTQAEEAGGATEAEPAADGTPAANGTDAGVGAGTSTFGAPAAGASLASPRRKRKAKGWFCPVCRQRKSSSLNLKLKSYRFRY